MRAALLGTLGDPRTEQEKQATAEDANARLEVQLRECLKGRWEQVQDGTYPIAPHLGILTVQTAVGTTADYQVFTARWGSRLPYHSENLDVGVSRGRYGNWIIGPFLPARAWAPEHEKRVQVCQPAAALRQNPPAHGAPFEGLCPG